MTIPTRAIDRLFERLAATYGAAWARQWDSVPIMDVKSLWAHELSIYGDRLEVLAWALENLPEFVPNAIQFRNLCRSAPAPATKLLPSPKADPDRVKAELAKLGHIARPAAGTPSRGRDTEWIARGLERIESGAMISPTVKSMILEAAKVKGIALTAEVF
jgi:hypothetical protein